MKTKIVALFISWVQYKFINASSVILYKKSLFVFFVLFCFFVVFFFFFFFFFFFCFFFFFGGFFFLSFFFLHDSVSAVAVVLPIVALF